MCFPMVAFPFQWGKMENERKKFSYLCLSVAIISTMLGLLQPVWFGLTNYFIYFAFHPGCQRLYPDDSWCSWHLHDGSSPEGRK